MPSVRFSRDKRGYEYVYLMHTPTRRGKPGRSQVLYWYRTPPGVRVGRKPFSEDVQRMLEAQHPGVAFDWPAIINTPVPPPDMTEFWREKRRAAKAAKEERRAQEAAEAEEETAEQTPRRAAEADAVDEPAALDDEAGDADLSADLSDDEEPVETAATGEAETGDDGAARKRRRRRGGRRRRSAAARQSSDGTAGDAGSSAPEDEATASEAALADESAPPQTEPAE